MLMSKLWVGFAAVVLGTCVSAGPKVELKTNLGSIVIEMDEAAAPKHVENFLGYAKSGFYEGTIFHRVIRGFMAQGGGFTTGMLEKPTSNPVMHEGDINAKVGAKNLRGSIATARAADPQSGKSQFFINYADNATLDFKMPQGNGFGYTVFGRVISGMDVVDKMADIPCIQVGAYSDVPIRDIVIQQVLINGVPSTRGAIFKDISSPAIADIQQSGASTSSGDNSKDENRRFGRQQCTVARAPSTQETPEESYQFWGQCDSNDVGITGVVVSTYNGVPTALRCMANGGYSDNIGEFDACNAQWAKLPKFCTVGDFKGQCEDGVPNGVGVRHAINYSRTEVGGVLGSMFGGMVRPQEAHEITRGMFKDGQLDGFGSLFSVSGCGMAGCSGNRTSQTGWFEKGQLRFECDTVRACAAKVSGAAFTSRFKPRDGAAVARARGSDVPAASFDEAIARFDRSGQIDDLKAARTLAKTRVEQAVLEFNILRTAGYEKGLAVTARLVQGDRSVSVDDSQRLMGFYRSVDSTLPLKLRWQISPNAGTTTLRLGTYRVKLRLGVVLKSTTRTCLGSACNDRDDTEAIAKNVDTLLSPSKSYRASGEVTLMAPGAGSAMTFGVASLKNVKSTEPLVAIESVELVP